MEINTLEARVDLLVRCVLLFACDGPFISFADNFLEVDLVSLLSRRLDPKLHVNILNAVLGPWRRIFEEVEHYT